MYISLEFIGACIVFGIALCYYGVKLFMYVIARCRERKYMLSLINDPDRSLSEYDKKIVLMWERQNRDSVFGPKGFHKLYQEYKWWYLLIAPFIVLGYLLVLPYRIAYSSIANYAKDVSLISFGIASLSFNALKIYIVLISSNDGVWWCLLSMICAISLGLIVEGLFAAAYAFAIECTEPIGKRHPLIQAIICITLICAICFLAVCGWSTL